MKARRGQSLVEYSVLLCIILSALLIMQFYVKRAYQGRIKQEADEIGQQYSPGHTTSVITTITTTNSRTYTGGEVIKDDGTKVAVPDGMTVSLSDTHSAFNKQEGVDSFASEGIKEEVIVYPGIEDK